MATTVVHGPLHLPSSGPRRAARTSALDWQLLDEHDDTAWQTALAAPLPSATRGQRAARHRLSWLLASFALAAVIATTTWVAQWAEHNVSALEHDLTLAVEADRWSVAMQSQTQSKAVKILPDPGAMPIGPLARPDLPGHVTLLALSGDQALVTVAISLTTGSSVYRQTQAYRQTVQGWTRIAPTLALWGEPRRLESQHLIFEYYAHDEDAVRDAAAKLDRLYPDLVAAYPLDRPRTKPTILVSPLVEPKATPWRHDESDRLVTASPALYLAPASVSDADILGQAVLLAFADDHAKRYVVETYDRTPLRYEPGGSQHTTWYPLAYGVRLWQLWQADLPLAAWRTPVIHWLLEELPNAPDQEVPVVMEQFCADVTLWRTAPTWLDVPVWCTALEQGRDAYHSWLSDRTDEGAGLLFAMDNLQPYVLVAGSNGSVKAIVGQGLSPHPATVVLLETIVEYAAVAYGDDLIPSLLAQAQQHESWDTLIPAVFEVSAPEFEQGWHTYLAKEYAIHTAGPR